MNRSISQIILGYGDWSISVVFMTDHCKILMDFRKSCLDSLWTFLFQIFTENLIELLTFVTRKDEFSSDDWNPSPNDRLYQAHTRRVRTPTHTHAGIHAHTHKHNFYLLIYSSHEFNPLNSKNGEWVILATPFNTMYVIMTSAVSCCCTTQKCTR